MGFLRPYKVSLIVPVGRLAIEQLLGIKDLESCIGRSFPCRDAVAIPLPHSSGASAWPNVAANWKRTQVALRLIRRELAGIHRNQADR